jgi:hypothetical protein
MKQYTVAYIKNGEEYAYDNYMVGATISEILEVLTWEFNRYGVDYDEIAICEMDSDEPTVYYEVVEIDGKYQLEA